MMKIKSFRCKILKEVKISISLFSYFSFLSWVGSCNKTDQALQVYLEIYIYIIHIIFKFLHNDV